MDVVELLVGRGPPLRAVSVAVAVAVGLGGRCGGDAIGDRIGHGVGVRVALGQDLFPVVPCEFIVDGLAAGVVDRGNTPPEPLPIVVKQRRVEFTVQGASRADGAELRQTDLLGKADGEFQRHVRSPVWELELETRFKTG